MKEEESLLELIKKLLRFVARHWVFISSAVIVGVLIVGLIYIGIIWSALRTE
ncbi:hypothetical protein Back11_14110 [Paenibacillus baekrokdamisoli]|uniref:Uncharacterized protein n=1 Tax=Paenibacillus baekrokdamisoli TaxID=1712516 RepID=A0A3G9INZ5_9BACL|nr:hypothetical protein [Paenibacillus baekrokdamisoli]BBH20066.1 hypothetical protein Back11_14110 [Paenibacillus baekrokdamisoli]